jgi:transcriptional regulator with PAS, ATPase and Fis domain
MGSEQQASSARPHTLRLVDQDHPESRAIACDLLDEGRPIIGSSVCLRRCLDLAKRAAASRSTVIILGESGTGKEVFARAIHRWSARSSGPFIAINCVGLSKELLESELFGHEKGAFTGAHQLKRGKMELADGGTVLLDEIGDLPIELQIKLLRFLQEREFERVGGMNPIRVDVRIIAATNRDLRSLVRSGNFRNDLYHRLNVICITLPPLRERPEDAPELARYFLRRFAWEAKKHFSTMSREALERLCAYSWPGNVRELANVIERAVALGTGPTLSIADLPKRIFAQAALPTSRNSSYREAVNEFRRKLIAEALGKTGGNQAAAARILGLHPKYLQRAIKSLGVG